MDTRLLPDCDSEQDRLSDMWKEIIHRLDSHTSPHLWADFDIKNWREMDVEGLWRFYDFIQEFTWDSSSVDFTISRTSVKP